MTPLLRQPPEQPDRADSVSRPEPFYADNLVTIFHGDCREILPTLGRESVDLVLTDPPFFMPATHHSVRTKWQRAWADTSVLATFWGAILDVTLPLLKPTGHFLMFCDGASYPVFYPEMYRRFDSLVALVWDKGHFGMGKVWRRQHELLIAARWDTSRFSEEGGSRSDVLKASVTPSSDRTHPVEKPSKLLAQLIEPTTRAGGVVLDPFMGSGTTLRAAKDLDRRAIGVEMERHYCDAAARIVAQDNLFGAAA